MRINTFAILGLQFGDEGKGKISDFLSSSNKDNIHVFRFNGGSNAGHTICIEEKEFYTHLIPSGVLCPKAKNYIGSGVVVNLEDLFKEIDEFARSNVDLTDKLFICESTTLVLNLHKKLDAEKNKSIGTTGKGIGPAYSDKASRTALRFDDLRTDNWIKKLESAYKPYLHLSYGNEMKKDIEFIKSKISRIRPMIISVSKINEIFKDSSNTIIIEGANATMLDITFGTYPYVTSSNCLFSGIFGGLGIPCSNIKTRDWEVIGVVKAYSTRVGGGVLPTEYHDETGLKLQSVGKEVGVTTRRKRRCGAIDLVQLKYAQMLNGVTCLNLTKLDVLNGFEKVKICVEYKGLTNFPSNEEQLNYAEPVYKELKGWNIDNLDSVKFYSELPKEIKDYVEFIEDYIKVPVKYINTGAERSQMIIRSDDEIFEVVKRINKETDEASLDNLLTFN